MRRSGLLWSLLRLALTTAILSVGFGLLRFLWLSGRIPGGYFQAPPDAGETARAFALWCAIPFLILSLVVEAERTLLDHRLTTEQDPEVEGDGDFTGLRRTLWIPIEVSLVLVLFAWKLFPEPEWGPKQTLILAGSAYLGFLAASLQILISPNLEGQEEGFSAYWYVIAVLLAVTFAGGMSGWLDNKSAFEQLWEYRQKEWKPGELIPIDGDKAQPFVRQQSRPGQIGLGDSICQDTRGKFRRLLAYQASAG